MSLIFNKILGETFVELLLVLKFRFNIFLDFLDDTRLPLIDRFFHKYFCWLIKCRKTFWSQHSFLHFHLLDLISNRCLSGEFIPRHNQRIVTLVIDFWIIWDIVRYIRVNIRLAKNLSFIIIGFNSLCWTKLVIWWWTLTRETILFL